MVLESNVVLVDNIFALVSFALNSAIFTYTFGLVTANPRMIRHLSYSYTASMFGCIPLVEPQPVTLGVSWR